METQDISRKNIFKSLTTADVSFVYSGRPGCACGCRGKYWFSSAFKKVAEQRFRTVSDTMVRHVIRVFQNADAKDIQDYGDFFALDVSEKRTYTLYLKQFEQARA